MKTHHKTIKGFPNYIIDIFGNITNVTTCKILKHQSNRRDSGYSFVNLYRNGKRYNRLVHILVAETFLGERPVGKVIHHKDSNTANPKLSNLEYISHSKNCKLRKRPKKYNQRHLKFTPNERYYLDDLWRRSTGMPEAVKKESVKLPSLEELRKSEWCPEFEKLMRNRLVMGAFRYGQIRKQNFNKYDLIQETHKRLDKFTENGNLEHLVDSANMLLLRFYNGRKNGEVFQAIDDGEHAKHVK